MCEHCNSQLILMVCLFYVIIIIVDAHSHVGFIGDYMNFYH
jgi:hypothetical protein